MGMLRRGFALAALASFAMFALTGRAHAADRDRVGDVYEITVHRTSEMRGDGSSGNSSDTYAMLERVVAVRDGGVELVFDLPEDATEEDRAREWQFPVRVFKPQSRALQLLNEAELKTRVDAWLESAGLTEAACGRWFFSWTAIKIECDPQSVLGTLASFDLRGVVAGANTQQIDAGAIRRERAEMDVAAAQMMNRPPLTLEAALQARAGEQYSGEIITRVETSDAGDVTRRVVTSELQVTKEDGAMERTTTTTITERRRIGRRDQH